MVHEVNRLERAIRRFVRHQHERYTWFQAPNLVYGYNHTDVAGVQLDDATDGLNPHAANEVLY